MSLAGLTLLLGAGVVRELDAPLVGERDVNQWEYIGFYVSENFRWTPLPHLELVNDQVFYPYGTSNVFQSWGLERDLLYSAFFAAFGHGPWLRHYYLASLLIGFFGVYLLLFRDFGHARATAASVLANLFNFYAINKYPGHLNIAVVHWMTLGFVVDFLIFRGIALRRWPTLRLVLARSCLTVLVLGSDLAYIASFSLLSLSVTASLGATLVICRAARAGKSEHARWLEARDSYVEEFRRDRPVCLAWIGVAVLFGWLYVPAILGVMREAASFESSTKVAESDRRVMMAASPLRLALPYFPRLNPDTLDLRLGDRPEGLGAGSVGWTLLVAAALGLLGHTGLWGRRRRARPICRPPPWTVAPLLALFVMLVLYGPQLPTLKLLPWMQFTRIASRTTVALPVLCALLSLGIPWSDLRRMTRACLAVGLAALGWVEAWVAYDLNHRRRPIHRPEAAVLAFMEHVRAQPGEAVLDWPFCVVGGNSVGLNELCPFYGFNHTISTYRRFHGKKTLGHYFGRLRWAHIRAHVEAGWPELLRAAADQRCFSREEWGFFMKFYALNDFAGIQLYPDLIPPECLKGFYRRLGQPSASTRLTSAGRLELIPKPARLRRRVDTQRGRDLRLGE